jgi:hypothetical protein
MITTQFRNPAPLVAEPCAPPGARERRTRRMRLTALWGPGSQWPVRWSSQRGPACRPPRALGARIERGRRPPRRRCPAPDRDAATGAAAPTAEDVARAARPTRTRRRPAGRPAGDSEASAAPTSGGPHPHRPYLRPHGSQADVGARAGVRDAGSTSLPTAACLRTVPSRNPRPRARLPDLIGDPAYASRPARGVVRLGAVLAQRARSCGSWGERHPAPPRAGQRRRPCPHQPAGHPGAARPHRVTVSSGLPASVRATRAGASLRYQHGSTGT